MVNAFPSGGLIHLKVFRVTEPVILMHDENYSDMYMYEAPFSDSLTIGLPLPIFLWVLMFEIFVY